MYCEGLLGMSGEAQNFNHVLREAGDIESEWVMFCASIVKVVEWNCGHKVVGA